MWRGCLPSYFSLSLPFCRHSPETQSVQRQIFDVINETFYMMESEKEWMGNEGGRLGRQTKLYAVSNYNKKNIKAMPDGEKAFSKKCFVAENGVFYGASLCLSLLRHCLAGFSLAFQES